MSDLYKSIPTNMRLFGEYLTGNNSDITADDFTQEELSEIRNRITAAKEKNTLAEDKLKASLVEAKKYVAKRGPNGYFGMKNGRDRTADEYLKGISDELATYSNTRGKTSVPYGTSKGDTFHQPGESPESQGIFDTLKGSFTSPGFNVNTSLGTFNAYDTPEGTRIEDTYDWTQPEGGISNSDMAKEAARLLFKPQQLGNVIARKFAPETKRRVNFTLPRKKAPMEKLRDYGRPGAIANGMYPGAMDIIRYPAQGANILGNALGLRTDEEAARAYRQIEEFSNEMPFTSAETRRKLDASTAKHPNYTQAANVGTGLLTGQTLLKPLKYGETAQRLARGAWSSANEAVVEPVLDYVAEYAARPEPVDKLRSPSKRMLRRLARKGKL